MRIKITLLLTLFTLSINNFNRVQLTSLECTYSEPEPEITYTEARDLALEIIKDFEGFVEHKYTCPAGITTIGYGLTGEYINGRTKITKSEASQELVKIYDDLYKRIDKNIDVDLTEAQMGALVSLGFNLGITRLLKSSLIKDIHSGDFDSQDILKYSYARNKNGERVKLRGLENRRYHEMYLFNLKNI